MSKTIVGLFETRAKAENAVQDLIKQGCPRESVHIEESDALYSRMQNTSTTSTSADHKRDEGFMAGVRNFFEDIGFLPPDGSRPSELDRTDVTREIEGIRPGEVLVLVDTEDQYVDLTADILNRNGAVEIEARLSEKQRARVSSTQTNATASTASPQTTIPVMEEELQVGKRAVTRGGVRIYTRLVERPIEEQINLREEKVHVERHAVDRPVSENELGTFKEGTIEVTETAEQAVIAKRARVKEEVTISKETVERPQTIRETVRSTEVDINPLNTQTASNFSDYETEFRRNYETTYANRGLSYEEVLPVYQYGYQLGSNPQYHDRDWSKVESQIRRDWNPQQYGPWEKLKDAVRAGWERAVRH